MNRSGFLLLALLFISQVSFCQYGKQNFTIGYKSVVYKDFTRTDNSFDKELDLTDSASSPRIIAASIWYPSATTESDKKVSFGDFLPSIELNEKRDYNPRDSVTNSADRFAEYYNIGEAHLSSLINYSTQSYSNTKYLAEKFSLVIYIPGMNGFSFENHMLCEEIAKQGNVVISFNSKGSNRRWMEPNTIDYENQIRDVQFVIAETNSLTFVDNSKICLIGHSVGGYVNILTKIRDDRITSLVSLDGSMIHDLKRSNEFVYKDLSRVNCPFLSISTQVFDKAKIYLDSMNHADRYYYQTSSLKHRDFKSITYLLQPSIDSAKFKDYQKLNNLIVSFIDKVNNYRNQHEFDELSNNFSNSELITTSYLPSVPDFKDFRLMAYNTDFNDLANTYSTLNTQYPSFVISKDELYDWGNSLRYSGYFIQSIAVYKLLIDIYPDFVSGYNGLARTLLLQNMTDEAVKIYESALERNPNNEGIKRKLEKLKTQQSN